MFPITCKDASGVAVLIPTLSPGASTTSVSVSTARFPDKTPFVAYTFPDIPTPPVTTRAPSVLDVAAVAFLTEVTPSKMEVSPTTRLF